MVLGSIAVFVGAPRVGVAAEIDQLPSWNAGPAKQSIVEFVGKVTKEGTPEFVPMAERIAVFDMKTLSVGGEQALLKLVLTTHAGMTTGEFAELVKDWLATARNPKTKRPYTEMVFQPMIELLAYMRANGFKTYIVSGGGVEFMRVFSEQVYGVPPEQVIGSTGKTKLEVHDGEPVIVRLPQIALINDKDGKPPAINQYIGRRPIAAFGNSDGDFQMLEWTTAGAGPRFALYVHHDDAGREWAYDRDSSIGRFSRGLDEAAKRGWIVVSMKNDWKKVFSFESK